MSRKLKDCVTSDLTKQVGKVVKTWRMSHSVTQRALATKANCHRSLISTIERGAHSPTIDTLQRILTALGYSHLELFQEVADFQSQIGIVGQPVQQLQ